MEQADRPDPASLIARLAALGMSVATAESLTGGALCARLVDVPGASAVLRGGICCYATDLKATLLGVEEHLLARRGPVDREVCLAMARGARRLTGADLALATTGVAGPGPADGHPAGTVHVALVWKDGWDHRELHLSGDRNRVREGSVDAALHLLANALGAFDQGVSTEMAAHGRHEVLQEFE
ncbi:CinA family protein [Schaalia sp. 19OD2882]|uniref:CinA family protein n=1 Tax=Schaalia sp. 19OD2882 TaxID=2794089 RepID=UPI001C1E91B3|nr:CinA family protein [Schaalia sp. 19OD2882]QWW20705.1 CinA family protein [Schaalia sp. 19OD2882]